MASIESEMNIWRDKLEAAERRGRRGQNWGISVCIASMGFVGIMMWIGVNTLDRMNRKITSLEDAVTIADARSMVAESKLALIDPSVLDEMIEVLQTLERRSVSNQRGLQNVNALQRRM